MKLQVLLFLTFSLGAFEVNVTGSGASLAKACREGDIKTVEALLTAGLDPNALQHYGKTPLYYAVSFNHPEIVDLLLEYHADPNTPSLPLQSAAEMGNLRTSRMLVEAGANVNTRTTKGQTALHAAVEGDHLDVIRYLIDSGADINMRDEEGISPLDDAVWRGSVDATAILIAHGAKIADKEPRTGATPVNEAAYRGNTQLLQYLLQFGPDLALADKKGFTPLENAVRMGKPEAALLLLDSEAKSQKSKPSFDKALTIAISKDESTIIEALLHHGVKADAVTASGSTPLDLAALASAVKVTSILLTNGADPNEDAKYGSSPLQDAALKGSTAIVGLLLDHGARPNQISTGSGSTALYNAASFGRADVVKLLLARGAEADLCGSQQVTPYSIAVANGFPEIATEIQSRGGSKACKPPRR